MKKIGITLLCLVYCLPGISSKKIHDFEEMFLSPRIKATADHLIISDGRTLTIYIYSKKDFKLLRKFGRRGEGPGEFKRYFYTGIYGNQIFVSSMNKFSYFDLNGKILKEIPFVSFLSRPLMIRHKVVGSESRLLSGGKETEYRIQLIDPLKNNRKTLNRFRRKDSSIISASGKVLPRIDKEYYAIPPLYDSNGDLIVIGDPKNGFRFEFFNVEGDKLSEFEFPYTRIEISNAHKKKATASFEKDKLMKKRYRLVFPKYFPAFKQINLSNDKLYVFPIKAERSKKGREVFIFSLNGKLLTKSVVPYGRISLDGDRCFRIKENEETEMWELYVSTL